MWMTSHSTDGFNEQISKQPVKREIRIIILSLGKARTLQTLFQERCASHPHSKNQAWIYLRQGTAERLKCVKSQNVSSVSFEWDLDEF